MKTLLPRRALCALLLGAALAMLAGCGDKAGGTDAAAGSGASRPAANAAQMPPAAKAMADEHAKGAEADAQKRAAAMKAAQGK